MWKYFSKRSFVVILLGYIIALFAFIMFIIGIATNQKVAAVCMCVLATIQSTILSTLLLYNEYRYAKEAFEIEQQRIRLRKLGIICFSKDEEKSKN